MNIIFAIYTSTMIMVLMFEPQKNWVTTAALYNVYFGQYEAPVSFMTLYPIQ